MQKMIFSLILAGSILIGGCASNPNPDPPASDNSSVLTNSDAEHLRQGMTTEEVRLLVGRPAKVNFMSDASGSHMEVWYYKLRDNASFNEPTDLSGGGFGALYFFATKSSDTLTLNKWTIPVIPGSPPL